MFDQLSLKYKKLYCNYGQKLWQKWSCTVTNVVSGNVKFSKPCGIDQYRIVCNQYHMVYLIF